MVSQKMVLLSVLSLVLGVNLKGDGKLKVKKGETGEETDQLKEHFNDQLDKANENNQDKIPLHVICCKIVPFLQQIMPKFMGEVPYIRCSRSIYAMHVVEDPVKKRDKSCEMLECIFGKLELLAEDGTLQEQKLKDFMKEHTITEEQEFVSAALNKCFVKHNKNPDQGKRKDCKSGAGMLFGCIFADILTKCPKKTLWEDKLECK